MFEDKVGKFIDEIVDMLKPLSADKIRLMHEICDHIIAFRSYLEIPMIVKYSEYERLKILFILGFEAQLVFRYYAKGGLTDEDIKELIDSFCKVFSPNEFDQVFEQMKKDINDTINIVMVLI
jgi:hypothetical protein